VLDIGSHSAMPCMMPNRIASSRCSSNLVAFRGGFLVFRVRLKWLWSGC
jgi:hypothetical protein